MEIELRAAAHAALGDRRRLLIVDHLAASDYTVAELAGLVGMRGNLLAHHLDVLDHAGLIERRMSQGDHRRRYVSLRWDRLPVTPDRPMPERRAIAFVCTHNSARSQFAAALWESVTGNAASSAGADPADHVHPTAIRVASELGVDLSLAEPSGYDRLPEVDLVVSVCDRAREGNLPTAAEHVHWSVPDPVAVGTVPAFRSAFQEITNRIEHFTRRSATN